jgi:hypothetical protein
MVFYGIWMDVSEWWMSVSGGCLQAMDGGCDGFVEKFCGVTNNPKVGPD